MANKAIPLSELPVISAHSESSTSPEVFQSGAVILMNKPMEWSSFHVVKYVRNRIPAKKVGHAGTLDPLATGLLILCSGRATKSISQIQTLPKTYVGSIMFGTSTPSYDSATEADQTSGWKHITEDMIRKKLSDNFSGTIMQKPPLYSAIKVKGERLYKVARRGETADIKARPIEIYDIDLLSVDLPLVTLKIHCGKGTYIRSLAHDLGLALNSRAHLIDLKRTETGHFSVEDAMQPEEFDSFIKTLNNG